MNSVAIKCLVTNTAFLSLCGVKSVIKQRMQMYGSPYRSVLHCIRTVLHEEGFRAFYRSYTTQLSMNIPFQSLHFTVYEYARETLNPSRGYDPKTHVIAGATAGYSS